MRAGKVWWIVVAGVVGVIAYAWIDGGREPLHEIAVPLALPSSLPSGAAGEHR